MKSFAAALLLAAVNGAAMTAINAAKTTWATGYDVYITSTATDIVLETQGPVAADNWFGIDIGSKKFDGNGFTQSFVKATPKATIDSATFATTGVATAIAAGANAEWVKNAKDCLEASNLCDSKRPLTKAGATAITIANGTAFSISWAANASSATIGTAGTIQKAGSVTLTKAGATAITIANG